MDLADSIAALKAALEADSRIGTAILYGSAAAGRVRPSSDLDVALIARSPQDARSLEAGLLEFALLARHRIVDEPLAGRLARAAGLRNLIVHRYGDVSIPRLVEAIETGLADLTDFARALRARARL